MWRAALFPLSQRPLARVITQGTVSVGRSILAAAAAAIATTGVRVAVVFSRDASLFVFFLLFAASVAALLKQHSHVAPPTAS